MALMVIALASLLVVASAKPELSQSYQAPGSSFGGSAGAASFPPTCCKSRPQYSFNYAVNDAFGNDFGHQEGRDGYKHQGSYYVQLPDGRLQRVTYTVTATKDTWPSDIRGCGSAIALARPSSELSGPRVFLLRVWGQMHEQLNMSQ
ncbi:cuticle protein 19.8-like, partial [Penaeus monodon]|uniref:cuticle protein 19.8-like n=1 Tax=Penaeus monodon TaxID=6687 RepID=UPI0018A7D5C5